MKFEFNQIKLKSRLIIQIPPKKPQNSASIQSKKCMENKARQKDSNSIKKTL